MTNIDEYNKNLIRAFKKQEKYNERGKIILSFIELMTCNKSKVTTWLDALRKEETYKEFKDEEKYIFPIIAGLKDGKQPIIFDIAGNTGIEISGPAGSGKTWAMLSIIYNIILQSHPGDANFVIFDHKQEPLLETISRLPHVVGFHNHTDKPEMYVEYLKEVVEEINRRKKILGNYDVDKWPDLRAKFKNNLEEKHKFPWLFIVIEELESIMAQLEYESQDLKDEYADLLNIVMKQGRPLGIRVIKVIQNKTRRDIINLRTESSVRYLMEASEKDLETAGIKYKGNNGENIYTKNLPGECIFKENMLTEAIAIKTLGIGGDNGKQLINLLKMLALEWHTRVTDSELENKYPTFILTDNHIARRKDIQKDINTEKYL